MCVEWMVETEKNRASLSVEHVFANHTFLYFGVRDKLPSAAATQQSSPEPFTLTPSVRPSNHVVTRFAGYIQII